MENKKRVLLLVLNPFTHDARVLKEALSLKKYGYSVRVIAMHQEGLLLTEEKEGIKIDRIKLKSKNLPKNIFFKGIKYLELLYQLWKLYDNEEIVHCNDLDTLPLGYFLRKFVNSSLKIVYDAHEWETGVYWITGLKRKLSKILERKLIYGVNKMFTVSLAIANKYVEEYGIKRPSVLYNCPAQYFLSLNRVFLRKKLNIPHSARVFIYQGGLQSSRGVNLMLEVFKKLEINKFEKKGKFPVIVFIGKGELENKIKDYAKNSKYIYYHPSVPPGELLQYTSGADVGITLLSKECENHFLTLPNKLFEYISVDVPILATEYGQLGNFVKRYNIGKTCNDFTIDALYETVKEMVDIDLFEFSQNISLLKKTYIWEEQEKKLIKGYRSLTK
jgi:glycosyltransferase involved in cell wall biosynthesis